MTFATNPLRKLFINTADVRPDVFLNSGNAKTFLQFEVHSSKQLSSTYSEDDYYSTTRKLATGLAEQLRCLRQIRPEVVQLYGFYVPTGYFPTKPIEKLECIWDEEQLKFCITCYICSNESSFQQDLLEIFDRQQEIFNQIQVHDRASSLLLPLTQSFLGNFGNNALW